ncbi:MAG: hypothetical protein SHS37scaffold537_32 [Phage 68_12]|nr:MAG: hypothetical protein SHS37scaffold537_32 [Phage 68_12]
MWDIVLMLVLSGVAVAVLLTGSGRISPEDRRRVAEDDADRDENSRLRARLHIDGSDW